MNRFLKKKKKIFGESHSETVNSLCNLVETLNVLGRYEEANNHIQIMYEMLKNDTNNRERELEMLEKLAKK